jgi:hypothetical protein
MLIFRRVLTKTVKNPILVNWIFTRRNRSEQYCPKQSREILIRDYHDCSEILFAYNPGTSEMVPAGSSVKEGFYESSPFSSLSGICRENADKCAFLLKGLFRVGTIKRYICEVSAFLR